MRKVIVLIFYLLCVELQLFAQDNEKSFHRTISVDGTYLLSFFKTEEARITPINFKYSYNRYSIRSGFNLNYGSDINPGGEEFNGDIKIGIEFPKRFAKKWKYYYGADLTGAYTTYNSSETTITRFTAIPFVGFEVFFSSAFALGYEPSLLASYTIYKNTNSFGNPINYGTMIKITGLSQFFINFHF